MKKEFVSKRPKRIGKYIGGFRYIHRSAVDTLTLEEQELVNEKTKLLPVKYYNQKNCLILGKNKVY